MRIFRDNLRLSIIKKRANLNEQYIRSTSNKIYKKLCQLDEYRNAKNLALYYSAKGEVSLERVWQAAPLHGKACFFPVCNGEQLYFLPATPKTSFKRNHFGILEPDVPTSEAISLSDLDLILAPLVAFDQFGVRLGMGKGFYDRTFFDVQTTMVKRPIMLGMAYEFQHQPVLDKQPWDVLLHGTITEKTVYWTNKEL